MATSGIELALKQITGAIACLNIEFPHRKFTMDGRLVGDLGEVIADLHYDIVLDETSRAVHDAKTSEGRDVQIKATFKDHLTFGKIPQLYLGLRLHPNGHHEEIYNGPGKLIAEHFKHRANIGEKLISLSVKQLKSLSTTVDPSLRVLLRAKELVKGD